LQTHGQYTRHCDPAGPGPYSLSSDPYPSVTAGRSVAFGCLFYIILTALKHMWRKCVMSKGIIFMFIIVIIISGGGCYKWIHSPLAHGWYSPDDLQASVST
jgi:hypothetical protein